MKAIRLRPAEIDRDFKQLAELFSLVQDEPSSASDLKADYEEHKDRIFRLMVAEDEQGALLGFNWATRSRFDEQEAYLYVIVKPDRRGQGAGMRLYDDLEQAAKTAGIQRLIASVRDNCPRSRAFAGRCGFTERSHQIAMALDMAVFDDRPYHERFAALCAGGFDFTSMAALGNTEYAQRKLYALNDTAASETPGSEGAHSWLSFEDFQQKVCGSEWYIPAGQIIAIDTTNGVWAAMSAITRFKGVDWAYNLFTGVDKAYRGRKLAQAVKVLALCYARDVLHAASIRTHHNALNLPMIAIDRKLGYVEIPGYFTMQKMIAG